MAAANDDHKLQADSLYERHGKPLEKSHRGQYVAISAEGQTVLAPTVLEVAEKALEILGPGSFVFKVGEKLSGDGAMLTSQLGAASLPQWSAFHRVATTAAIVSRPSCCC